MLPLAALGPESEGRSSCAIKDRAKATRAALAARTTKELLRASAITVVLNVASAWPAAGVALLLAAPDSNNRCNMGTRSVAKACFK